MRRLLWMISFFALELGLTGCSFLGGSKPGNLPGQPGMSVVVTGPASMRLSGSALYTATVIDGSSAEVTWQVNGKEGGDSTYGTIAPSGLYTAPPSMPTGAITITASAKSRPSVLGSLTSALLNPLPILKSALATQVGSSTNVLVDVKGSGFIPSSTIQVGREAVSTIFVSATELQAVVSVTAGSTSITVGVANPDPGGALSPLLTTPVNVASVSPAAAARLLDQATFGPTLDDMQHVQKVGMDAWLTEQFAAPVTTLAAVPAKPLPSICQPYEATYPCVESEWWQAAITGKDQLRQRVAFALSQIFVVSTLSIPGESIPGYHNVLANDAFGNFRTLMRDVTLQPAMGGYLNMLNSAKAEPGQIANENYGREMLQLFTTGIDMLNEDGTLATDSAGKPVPVYTEAQVEAFARAYTGWTYGSSDGSTPDTWPAAANWTVPMVAVESQHDTSAKVLLNGETLPSGQTASQDLDGALDNIFKHSNVGPFLCRQLIQHLVTSNPSPVYVRRVVAIFNDNGLGVRGDLKAVVRAILLDQEARAGDTDITYDGGHLREPILFMTATARALAFTNTASNGSHYSLSNLLNKLNENPYRANSVFNFFPPNYVIPGTQINAPEFGIENTATVTLRLTLADQITSNTINGFNVDLSATSNLGQLAKTPGDLVDALGTLFLHSQMSPDMRTAIINAITPLTDMGQRVRIAVYLVITSSDYKVIH